VNVIVVRCFLRTPKGDDNDWQHLILKSFQHLTKANSIYKLEEIPETKLVCFEMSVVV
jgi:hypothetical protein